MPSDSAACSSLWTSGRSEGACGQSGARGCCSMPAPPSPPPNTVQPQLKQQVAKAVSRRQQQQQQKGSWPHLEGTGNGGSRLLACMHSSHGRSHIGGGSTRPAATQVPSQLRGNQSEVAGAAAGTHIREPLPASRHRASAALWTGEGEQPQPAGSSSSSSSGRSKGVARPVRTPGRQPAAATAAPTLPQSGPAAAPPAEFDEAYWYVFELLQQAAGDGSASDAIVGTMGGAMPWRHVAAGPQYKRPLPGAQLHRRQPTSPLARQLAALRSSAYPGQRTGGGPEAAAAAAAAQQAGGCGGAGACLGGGAAAAEPRVPQLAATTLPYAISLLVPQDLLPPPASTADPHDATAQAAAAAALRENCREGRWVADAAAADRGRAAQARFCVPD